MCAQLLSRVLFFVTPWTVVHQASLSMGFSRQEYWSGLPFPTPGDLPDPGVEPMSAALQVDSLPLSHLRSLTTSDILLTSIFTSALYFCALEGHS